MVKKLWGGRFSKRTNPLVEQFTRSIDFDYKIALYDILGSIAHVKILKRAGYLTSKEAKKLDKALDSIYENITKKRIKFDKYSEDIHTNIQNILQKKVGDLALKLQTARSRNEQVLFATKLYCQVQISKLIGKVVMLHLSIWKLTDKYQGLIIPGFTHLQHAQPVWLKDYLRAYIEMLDRDIKRLRYIRENIKITLSAGALAGTPIKRSLYRVNIDDPLEKSKEKLHIEPVISAIDSVSDRDFVIEIISALSIIAMHLSRLSEDLIIWSTKEFDFVEIDEAFCTGSSLMPQKKNPDVLELIRGYAGRLYGNLVSVLTMMKGLPLTYNRDMQLDKEPLFNSFEVVSSELKVLTGLIKTLKFNEEKIEEYLKDESLYATELVYYLVDRKVSFKEAHTIVGKLIKYSLANGIQIKDMPEDLLKKKFSNKFVKEEVVKLFDPKVSVASRKSVKRKKVDKETLDKIVKEAKGVSIAGGKFIVPSLEHLIALKLHSLKYNPKLRENKDLPDIIDLIRIHKLKVKSKEFRDLCLKFGTEELYNKVLERV